MPQSSVPYAVGRLSVLSQNALKPAHIERLLRAPSAEDARRALTELGWPEAGDYEALAQARVKSACGLARALSTDQAVTDSFLLHYDIANLKRLLKARALTQDAGVLSDCGIYDPASLRHMTADHRYKALAPQLREALEALEDRMAVKPDPLDIDATLDKAMFSTVFAWLKGKPRAAARAYFRGRVDFINLLALLRIRAMGRGDDMLKTVLIPGGFIPENEFAARFSAPEKLPALIGPRYGKTLAGLTREAVTDSIPLPRLERAAEDELLKTLYPRGERFCPEAVPGYLIAREREAAAVRLILAGKQNGFSELVIRERLRELYG